MTGACKLGTGPGERQAEVACEKFHKLIRYPALWPELLLKRDEKPPKSVEISRYLGYGLTWALSTLLFLYLGTLGDQRLGTEPALTLLGAFVGAAAGFYYMYRHLVGTPPRKNGVRKDGDT